MELGNYGIFDISGGRIPEYVVGSNDIYPQHSTEFNLYSNHRICILLSIILYYDPPFSHICSETGTSY